MTIAYFYDVNKFGLVKMLLFGFLFGLILSMLFAYIIVLIPVLIFVFLLLKRKERIFIFLAGLFFAFAPLVLFELKNNFVMLKNTFIDKSYLSFVNNTNLPGGVKLNKNIFTNSLDLINKMQSYFGISIYLVILFLMSSFTWLKKYKERLLIFVTGISFVILVFLLRFQYSGHYLLPFLTLTAFCSLIIVAKSKLKILLLIISVIFLTITFPKNYYTKAERNYSLVKSRVEKTLDKKLISKSDKFNIILKRKDDAPTPAGNEYRFFFLINGYEPQSEFLYKDSQKLFIFSEESAIDFDKFKTWEMTEFDHSQVKKSEIFMVDQKMFVYVLEK